MDRLGGISKRGDRYLRRLVRGRSARRHPLCQDPWHQAPAMAHGIVGATADEGGEPSHSPTRSLGWTWAIVAKGQHYKEPRRACGVNEIAPDIRRDVKVGRTNST